MGKSVNKARKAASCGKQVFYGAGPRSEKNWKGSGEKKVSPVLLIGVVLCLGFMVWREFWA